MVFHVVLWVPYLASEVNTGVGTRASTTTTAATTATTRIKEGKDGCEGSVLTIPSLDHAKDRSSWLIQRAKLHTLVQTTVCTLWRSRVASEAHTHVLDENKSRALVSDAKKVGGGASTDVVMTEKRGRKFTDDFEKMSNGDDGTGDNGSGDGSSSNGDNGSGDGNGHVVQPTLSIVFANNYVITVTQRAMVRQMVKMGMGAPSGKLYQSL